MIFNFLKNKKSGTVLTEALISLFILGTLFISIATAVTASISNTKRFQEVNETSAYAQKIADSIYSISQSDSGAFFQEIEKTYKTYLDNGDFSNDCIVNLDTIAQELEYRSNNGEEGIIGLYDVLNYYNDDYNNGTGANEMTEYDIDLYILPSENVDTNKSVNYFVSYNPLMATNSLDGGRIYNTEVLNNVYTFKLVVSKTVNTLSTANTNFVMSSPASVTYIFQISSNGG